jgi:hypothetical protein
MVFDVKAVVKEEPIIEPAIVAHGAAHVLETPV